VSVAVALQAVLTGLAVGAVYGLVGMGFSLVHQLTRVLSFAHGDLVVGAVFSGVYVAIGTTPVAIAPSSGRSALLVVGTVVAGAVLATALYVAAVRPFAARGGDPLGWVAATLAAGLLIREAGTLVFPREAYAIPDPLRLNRLARNEFIRLPGDQTIEVRLIGVLLIAVAVGVAVDLLLVRSRLGKSMRAVADDADVAALLGINPRRVALIAFAVAGALAGLAGLLIAPSRALAVGDGVILGLKGIAAAVLAGLGSVRGALLAGLALGVVESLATSSTALGPAYRDVLPLAVLVVVLAARPQGLFRRVDPVAE
jgi:branched-subunit amino acid ABC-type transport system permease component